MIRTSYELTHIENATVTFGFFDGLHNGHKKLIKTLVRTAELTNSKSVVVVFDKNWNHYFGDNTITENIFSFKDLQLQLDNLGVDVVIELNFEKYKNYTAEEFLKYVLVEYFSPSSIVIGRNYKFGKDLDGDSEFLKNNEEQYGYSSVDVIEETYEGEIITSDKIKGMLLDGDIKDIKDILGNNFFLYNSVTKGNRKSATICFPTANIFWPQSVIKLPYGVYLGYCQADKTIKPALISWGTRPTLSDESESYLEVYLLDYKGDLCGKLVKTIFVKKLRDQEKFENTQELKQQLMEDCFACKKWAKLGA